MNLNSFFRSLAERTAAIVLRRALLVIALVSLVAVVGAIAALRLSPDTGVDSITGTKSATYKATQAWAKQFGGDPVVILVRGDLPRMLLGPDLGVMLGLEGCIAGNIPDAARSSSDTPQVCKRLADFKPAVAVYGPGTYVNTAALSVNKGIEQVVTDAEKSAKEAGDAARKIAQKKGKPPAEQERLAQAAEDLSKVQSLRDFFMLGTKYGLGAGNLPSLDNQAFVSQLVFDPARGSKTPKSRVQYLFPNSKSAIIQVRLRPDLTPSQRAEAVDLIKRATSNAKYQLDNGKYTVTGAPVVLASAQDAIEQAIVTLLIGALIVMLLVLLVVFPAELRLLPLVLALAAAALTYGLLALTGSSLGVGAVAVLPVLVGLAVDYAIQFHARADAAFQRGEDAHSSVMHAARSGGPPVLAAALAAIASLLALAFSPVPLIRGFGLLLVAGVALAIAVVLTLGFATLGWAGGVARKRKERHPAEYVAGLLRLRPAFAEVVRRPSRIVAITIAVAAVGWIAGFLSPVSTDVRQLVPSNLQAAKDIQTLQKTTGTSGEIDVLVRARDVTDPKVIEWMRDYQTKVLAKAGYKGENPTCEKSKLCPALSLTDLFRDQNLSRESIRSLLDVGDFSRGVISPGRRMATMAFGVRLESLNEQKEVVDMLRDNLNPPPGVRADVVGLTALAADASGALSNPLRRALIVAISLLLFFLVVLAVVRDFRRAFVPLFTVATAAGISALLLFVLRVDLNPMSAALGVFIIAIAGEFTLLIYLQYLRLRRREPELTIETAYRRAYRTVGPAVFASGVTAIAGFAVLALADISMLRGFALVAVVDLAVALAGTVLLLPAFTLWLEKPGRD